MPDRRTPVERFWAKIEEGDTGCWQWLGTTNERGYGQIRVNGKLVRPHRFAYELYVGPIPEELELDHLCRNPGCANPGHVEAVTHRENVMRGNGWAAQNAAKTHCPSGHPYQGDNVAWLPNGGRRCRACYP